MIGPQILYGIVGKTEGEPMGIKHLLCSILLVAALLTVCADVTLTPEFRHIKC